MYSIDINFLRDRPEYQPPIPSKAGGVAVSVNEQAALIAGIVVGVLPMAVVGGLWFLAQTENTNLAEQLAKLEQDASTLFSQDQQVKAIQAEAAQIKAQRDGIASIFNTSIKPIVAILQDIRERVPAGVQINQISQTITADQEKIKAATAPPPAQTPPPAPAPEATPPGNQPATTQAAPAPTPTPPVPWEAFTQKLKISGTARSFDDVNDFLLSLKQSELFNSNAIKLTKSELKENPLQPNVVLATEFKNTIQNLVVPKIILPDIVEYEIEVEVNQKLASEITKILRSKGAIGLATRIETLKQKGVIQP